MKAHPTEVTQLRARHTRGMTLPEMMVSVGIGCLVLAMMSAVFLTSALSFARMNNHVSMNQDSRSALDRMSRDIRQAGNLVSFSTNQLVFTLEGTNTLNYYWDPSSGQLVQWNSGDARTNVLLNGCDSFRFSMFKNALSPGGAYTSASTVAQAKCIGATWKCTRTVLGKKVNTEDMQQAVIVIRNKPVI